MNRTVEEHIHDNFLDLSIYSSHLRRHYLGDFLYRHTVPIFRCMKVLSGFNILHILYGILAFSVVFSRLNQIDDGCSFVERCAFATFCVTSVACTIVFKKSTGPTVYDIQDTIDDLFRKKHSSIYLATDFLEESSCYKLAFYCQLCLLTVFLLSAATAIIFVVKFCRHSVVE